MKILIVADTYYPDVNGCSYFAQRLAYYLEKDGHTVAVIAPSRSFLHTEEKKNNIRIFGISSLPILIYKDFRFARPFFIKSKMKQILQEFSPDIIHMQGHFTINRTLFNVAKKIDIPVVATNHFMPENLTHYLPLPKKMIEFKNKYMWYDFAKVFDQIPFITTPTEIAADLIRPHLSMSVTSISCGIDLEKFRPRHHETDGKDLKKNYKIPENRPALLYVGRLDAEKKIDQIIEASAKALKKVDFSLVIAGKGKESDNLKNLAKKLNISNSIFFTDFVSDENLPTLYKIADCFVIACPFELQSIVTMEAMATGLPVIAVNAGALPHLVEQGINGMLFKEGDVEMLAENISIMMSHKEQREKMSVESLRMIADHGIEEMVRKYLVLYQQAIEYKYELKMSN